MRVMKIAYEMTLPYKPTRKFMKAGRLPSMTQVEENFSKRPLVGWWG